MAWPPRVGVAGSALQPDGTSATVREFFMHPPDRSTSHPPDLLDLSPAELRDLLAGLGQPRYRADQVFDWVYSKRAPSFDDMTNLPQPLRVALSERLRIGLPEPLAETASEDGLTRKTLFRLSDGRTIETVLMLYADAPRSPELAEGDDPSGPFRRRTVCISTQVGCPIGCPFCATGQAGYERNLSTGEIVGQVLATARTVESDPELRPTGKDEHPLTNVVFMGMGEPLMQFDTTWGAVEALTDPKRLGLGARRITISTAGLVPGIDRLAETGSQVNLAVSLHAPDDELRNVLVPINRKHSVRVLMAACSRYAQRTGRRVTFEYALMDHVNDTPRHARGVVRLLEGLLAHVNLIPLNPTPASAYGRAPFPRVKAFERILRDAGIPTTLRVEKGIRIAAGCGQLRQSAEKT